MKYLLRILPLFLVFFFLVSRVRAEEITGFTTGILIRSDGKVDVSEYVRYDFGTLARHGIYRTLPFIKTNRDDKKYTLDFENIYVIDEKEMPYRFTQSSDNGILTLKIGDPDRTVSGSHLYVIRYRVLGALTYFSDHDELYWNVTGSDWQVPIRTAYAEIRFAPEFDLGRSQTVCYTGVSGSTASNCRVATGSGAILVSAGPLSAGEGLTVAVSFPKNLVSVLEPREYTPFWDTLTGEIVARTILLVVVVSGLVWYVGLPVWIIIHWMRWGRDPRPPMGVASAWFDVPKTKKLRPLTPGETGTLVDEVANMRDVTATLVDLARRGYMKIVEEKKDDFSLAKTKEVAPDADLMSHEKTLLEGIFDAMPVVRLKDATLVAPVADAKKKLYESVVAEGFFAKNPQSTRTIYMVVAVVGLFTFNLPLAVIAFVFGRAMPAKTMFGAQAAAVASSLRNFLASQEKKLEFQAKNQMFFERLLPYAVAFGVEKIWAERFRNITMKPPDWYEGYGGRTFNSILLANALSSSFHTGIVSAATPTSSSSGFSSGFGGGGFSGGGGGGGGGGSW